jgi:hypothetical protein
LDEVHTNSFRLTIMEPGKHNHFRYESEGETGGEFAATRAITIRAPLILFYKEWNPKSGKPQPHSLARHVVSHRIADTHLDDYNCLKALMLMASTMATVHRLQLGRPAIGLV